MRDPALIWQARANELETELERLREELGNANRVAADYKKAYEQEMHERAELKARLEQERDQAIAEANRRDQKWMDGINEKLDYGDPSSPDAASKALEQFVKQPKVVTD